MNRVERQRLFLEAAKAHFGDQDTPREMFGSSNSAKMLEGGLQLGIVNLNGVTLGQTSISFASVMRFPPEDEVYFAVQVRTDITSLVQRLEQMKAVGASATKFKGSQEPENKFERVNTANIYYNDSNNNAVVYLAADGCLWLRNKEFWETLNFDKTLLQPPVEVESIVVALYPPTASARRSLLAREFIGWLGGIVGAAKIRELRVWSDAGSLRPEMLRMPVSLPVDEIHDAVKKLGGHYPNGEVQRFHAALNFLPDKHFVILSGISGTGKTQLALKYARAVHGVTLNTEDDPLIFECPVRPEWTDPTGLTGYFDALQGRYVVPPFLEAVLVATAHRNSPVFVILDELNLARVEYYLSDILSCMETRGNLRLHTNNVPLEGTTGVSVRAELPLPTNLFIIGTINVDETTNPVSDKVLDRASVIEMSNVDVPGFLTSLVKRCPELKDARAASEAKLIEVHGLMQSYGQSFGYRLIEEFVRYHAFDAEHLKSVPDDVTDQLLVQKVLVKLRGAERQRTLLTSLDKALKGLPRAQAFVQRLLADLDDFGTFQAMR